MGFISDIVDGISGKSGADAAKNAANAQIQSTTQAIDFERESRDLARADLQPYNQAGLNRLNAINTNLNQDPYSGYNALKGQDASGYQWSTAGLNNIRTQPYQELQGFQDASTAMSRNVMGNAAARGKLGSGNTLMDLFRENASLGETMRNNAFNNALNTANFNEQGFANQFGRKFDIESFGDTQRNNDFNRNYNLLNLGQASAAGQATTAQNTGIGGLITDRGNSQASGYIGQSNAKNSGVNNMISLAAMAYGMGR